VSDNKDRPDFVPFGDWTYTPWWGGGSEPRMLPSDAMPERPNDDDAPRVVVDIAPDISDERRAEIEAAMETGEGAIMGNGEGGGVREEAFRPREFVQGATRDSLNAEYWRVQRELRAARDAGTLSRAAAQQQWDEARVRLNQRAIELTGRPLE